MLQSLQITNYALISSLEIDFAKGLSIITGETGAGKSILLGALSLIIGNRADTSVLKDKTKKCIVEACFSIEESRFESFFSKNDLDLDNNCIVRREILQGGKSRAFINDTPVKLALLKELGSMLIDIHSQHQSLLLGNNKFQLSVIDSLAKHSRLLESLKKIYHENIVQKSILFELQDKAEKRKGDLDYFQFQYNQLEELNLVDEDEQTNLEKELEELNHAEEIKLGLSNVVKVLNNDDDSILSALSKANSELNKLEGFFKQADGFAKRLQSAEIELSDLSDEIERYISGVIYEPIRIEEINERLSLVYTLQQKYKVSSIAELIVIRNDFDKQLNEIESYDEQIDTQKAICTKLDTEENRLATRISSNRKAILKKSEKKVTELLLGLGMPNSKFSIRMHDLERITESGKDKVDFLFSANKKAELQEINKVASGGEVSRLMLCIKSLISESTNLQTIIFDEIDTGVSGDIADKVGNIMKEMSRGMQVINITHLPQIAAKGDSHFRVFKVDDTYTQIKKLTHNERLVELAKMLSGSDISEAAMANAKVLLLN